MKGDKTLLDWRASSAGKRVECWGKVKRWEKELNTAKGGGSEQASRQQWSRGVKRSTAPRASADMQNVGNVLNMQNCKTCKTCTILWFYSSGKIQPQVNMIEVRTWILVSTVRWTFINCALFNTDLCLQPKKNQYFVSWPPFPSLASDPRGRVVKCRLASRNATNLACYFKPHPDTCPLIITTTPYVTFLHDI